MNKNRNITGIVIGVILIAIGIFSLFERVFTFINWDSLWPLTLLGIGAAFFIGMVLGDKTRGGLAVPGSILIMIGLILFVMNITGRWAAWAYAWALIIVASGFGTLVDGLWSSRPELRTRGLNTMRDGLVIFLILGVIMEFIFSLTGVTSFGNFVFWAVLLALVGLILLVTRLLRMFRADGVRVDLFWPVLMIGVGALGILSYLDWLPNENLPMLANLWPLLLIVAGVGILLRSRSSWTGAVLGALVVAVLFIVIYAGGSLGLRSQPFWTDQTGIFQIGDFSLETVTGSGSVITENRPVSGFDRVEMSIPGNLDIQQGAAESLVVSGDDNILPLLQTNVSGGKLSIRYRSGAIVRTSKPLQITLTVKNLSEFVNSSSGTVKIGPISTGDFHLRLSSSGDIDIENIQADQIKAELTSSGNITLRGSANQLDLQVTSSGAFQAGDLQVQRATVRLSSSGDVTVWVVEDLSVNISSSGNVSYYGKPSVHSTLTSSGEVFAKGEK
ncbi:MAG: GIN domain-containing protein [Omnitrophica WOR_2 bacterium]